MENQKEFRLWLATEVIVIAVCAWAATSVYIAVDALWIYSVAGVLIVLHVGNIALQGSFKTTGVNATSKDEIKKARRRPTVQQLQDTVLSCLLFIGLALPIKLANDNVLPSSAALLLLLGLLAGWFWLRRIIRGRRLVTPSRLNLPPGR